MELNSKDLFEKLEFDKVIELLKSYCLGEVGKVYFDHIQIETEPFLIRAKLKEVSEYKLSLEEGDQFPIAAYDDLSKDFRMVEIPGSVITLEGLARIFNMLQIIERIFSFFTETRQEVYPALFQIIEPYSFNKDIIKQIDSIMDEEGAIRPNATPELAKIRRGINSKRKELDREFRKLITNYRQKGWLTDNIESFRNGRRVLSVPSEHKRKIRGIIHDESATGKTAFIEPEQVININNDIFDLENEEKREIYRILKDITDHLRPHLPLMRSYNGVVLRFDIVQAKAQMAMRMDGNMPKVMDEPTIKITKGYHPLLWLKNQDTGKATIPFNLKLLHHNRIIVISGPNAGGKSVTMKALGLNQLLLQSGCLVPVDPLSEMGVFEKLFVDIGDQQSLEDDLSTYSSRLKNMKEFLASSNENTLILFDEFGSGTDPKMGGAIAEAILNEFHKKKVYGIITTHYSNLKIFAFKTKGIINGAMEFDKDTLSPTYKLKVGKPGSSYAFEIATKTGLSKKMLNYAKHKTGKDVKAVDELLVELQAEKKELEEKLDNITAKEKKLEKLIKNYENLYKDLEYKRKKFKLEAKEKALQKVADENKQLEKIIRDIREQNNLEKAKELAAEVKEKRKKLTSNITDLKEEIYVKDVRNKKSDRPIKVGDFVKLISGGATGKVESIQKNKAIVLVGQLKMTVKVRDLTHAKEPLDVKKGVGIESSVSKATTDFANKLDIRGMRREEAQKLVESFIDNALLANASYLRIVHGKGNGILRDMVKSKFKEYKAVKEIVHPEDENGGDGVTIAHLG